MQEQGQPQAVELVGDLRVEEGQEAADLVQAVHLQRQAGLGSDGGSAHTPEPQGAKDGSQGCVAGDAMCQLCGGAWVVWGTHTTQVLGREQPSIPSAPGDAEGLFSCPGRAFPKDIGAAWVRPAQVLHFLLPHTSKMGMQWQHEASR